MKGRVVSETQAGPMRADAERSGLEGLRASIAQSIGARRGEVSICRACGAFHRREAVICSEESCAAWLAATDARLTAPAAQEAA